MQTKIEAIFASNSQMPTFFRFFVEDNQRHCYLLSVLLTAKQLSASPTCLQWLVMIPGSIHQEWHGMPGLQLVHTYKPQLQLFK